MNPYKKSMVFRELDVAPTFIANRIDKSYNIYFSRTIYIVY